MKNGPYFLCTPLLNYYFLLLPLKAVTGALIIPFLSAISLSINAKGMFFIVDNIIKVIRVREIDNSISFFTSSHSQRQKLA